MKERERERERCAARVYERRVLIRRVNTFPCGNAVSSRRVAYRFGRAKKCDHRLAMSTRASSDSRVILYLYPVISHSTIPSRLYALEDGLALISLSVETLREAQHFRRHSDFPRGRRRSRRGRRNYRLLFPSRRRFSEHSVELTELFSPYEERKSSLGRPGRIF